VETPPPAKVAAKKAPVPGKVAEGPKDECPVCAERRARQREKMRRYREKVK
jgi:hypothetical protein